MEKKIDPEFPKTTPTARYAALVTVDDAGAPRDFATAGLTGDAHRHMAAWADGPRHLERRRDLFGWRALAEFAAFAHAGRFHLAGSASSTSRPGA